MEYYHASALFYAVQRMHMHTVCSVGFASQATEGVYGVSIHNNSCNYNPCVTSPAIVLRNAPFF